MAKTGKAAIGKHYNNPLNVAFRKVLLKKGLSDPEAAKQYKERSGNMVSHAHIGNYRRGISKLSGDFLSGWKRAFGDDIQEVSETIFSDNESTTLSPVTAQETDWYKRAIDILLAQNGEALTQNTAKFHAYEKRTEKTIDDLRSEKEKLWDLIGRSKLANDS